MRRAFSILRSRTGQSAVAPDRRRLHAGLLLLGVGAVLLYISFARGLPFLDLGDGVRVKASFADTSDLQSGDPVRVRGIEVGEVEGIALRGSGGPAIVTMRIEDREVRPARDASAHLRWRTLLGGNLYVDLDPGSPSAPALGDDAVIPSARTTYQVGLDDLNDPFGRSTPRQLRNLWRQFGRGMEDHRAVRRGIDVLSPALTRSARGIDPLRGERSDDLRALVASSGRAVGALGRNERHVRGLLAGGGATFQAIAANRRALGESLELSAGALDSTLVTMRRLEGTLERLDPLAGQLRPGARALAPALRAARPALDEAESLLEESRPLLRSLPRGLDRLADAGRSGLPLVRAFRPTLERLDQTLLPFLARRDPQTRLRNYEAIGPTAAVASAAAGEFDGGGYMLHFPAPTDERTLATSPCQSYLSDPTAEEKLRCEALTDVLTRVLFGEGGGG